MILSNVLIGLTGYTSNKWKSLCKVEVNPAFMTNTCETFIALEAIKNSSQNLDPFEEIEVFLEDLDNLNKLIKNGKITHSIVLTAVLFYLQQLQSE